MARTASRFLLLTVLTLAMAATALAEVPQSTDLTRQFAGSGATVDRLQVFEISGVVIIRGRTSDRAQAELLGRHATALGYGRVANLVQIVQNDDAALQRTAERELSINRSLDGCQFSVRSANGVVRIAGTVRHELQKDVALQVLRSIDGVKRVEMQLTSF